MWPWITDLTVVIFGGTALVAYFFERAVAAFALVFVWEREDQDE